MVKFNNSATVGSYAVMLYKSFIGTQQLKFFHQRMLVYRFMLFIIW